MNENSMKNELKAAALLNVHYLWIMLTHASLSLDPHKGDLYFSWITVFCSTRMDTYDTCIPLLIHNSHSHGDPFKIDSQMYLSLITSTRVFLLRAYCREMTIVQWRHLLSSSRFQPGEQLNQPYIRIRSEDRGRSIFNLFMLFTKGRL